MTAVLCVCTGNLCRSPMAERLLAARLARTVDVSSAGLRAVVGAAMDATSASVLRELGGDPEGHIARQLTAPLVRSADLVLTATSEQRALILAAEPTAMRRTFTLREFARLAAAADPSSLASLEPTRRIAAVAALRGQVDPPQPGADEIGDPIGAPLPVVRACGVQIETAVAAIAPVLA